MDAAPSETGPRESPPDGTVGTGATRFTATETAIKRWRLAEDAGRIGTWEWDPEADVTYWSAGAERLHALAPGTFASTHDAAARNVHPDDWAAVKDCVHSALRDGTNEVEYRILLPDGTVRWIWAFGRMEPGDRPCVAGIHMDITARKAAEAASAASESRFRAFAEAAPVLTWVSDTEGSCTYFNDQWLEFTGGSLEDQLGDGWIRGVHRDDVDRCLETYTAAIQARTPFEMEYRLRHHSGEYRWVLDRARPILGRDGKCDGFLGSCLDIGAHKRADESLRLLADIGVQLAGSLDREAILAKLAQAVVPQFADWCSVSLLAEGGELTRVAT
ncbi:MAG: PAS domain-containing protein, partial [Tepidiformaceae bacterium]